MRKHSINLMVAFVVTVFVLTGCGANTDTYDNTVEYTDSYDFLEELDMTTSNDSIVESNTIASAIVEPETTETETVEPETTETETVEPETTETETVEPETTAPIVSEPETIEKFTVSKNYRDILRIAELKATCETDINACYVDVNSDHNPYDVVWDYGEEYQAYVDACDWSLVWDYDYYIKTFPMLAELYHYDRELLLEHFQTVGIHEGRQGSAEFNFYAFRMNSDCYDFERAFAAYYFDYMLNYDSYTNINTVYLESCSDDMHKQYETLYTAAQMRELRQVNVYRKEVDADALYAHAELTCFANLRGYINVKEGYYAHEWFECNDFANIKHYGKILGPNVGYISENCIEGGYTGFPESYIYAGSYRISPDHYAAMIDTKYVNIGVSHVYRNESVNRACQFDAFISINN